MRSRLFCALAAAACSAVALVPPPASATDSDVYHHLGTWVDIFDGPVFAAPSQYVARMKGKGVRTIYVETSNYNSGSTINFEPGQEGLIESAHDAGLRVVAWTLPGHVNQSDDAQKALAAINFKTPRGDRFDGFALDIEATIVPVATRNQRLLDLSAQIKAAAKGMPLGAITFSPVFINSPWPNFPWASLAQTYDVFMPMIYSTYHFNSQRAVRNYTKKGIKILRKKTYRGVPIHVIGGIANGMTAGETKGFVKAVRERHVAGASLYDFRTTGTEDWRFLKRVR